MNLQEIATWIVSSAGIVAFCGLILLFAVYWSVRMLMRLVPRRRALHAAVRRLEAYDDEAAFADGFESFNSWMQSHGVLAHVWREFVETLILHRANETKRVGNTVPAEVLFTRESILTGVNTRWYAALPNLLTGLGILGTFVGLVAGIWLASAGLSSTELEQMRDALSKLLSGASLAFMTSVVGLFLSLVFNSLEKLQLHRIDELIVRWCDRLDSLLHRVTLEAIGTDALHEAQEQRKQLERFNTDLALQIASALDERIADRLAPQVERLINAVDGLRGDQSASLRDTLESVAEAMSTRFQKAFSGAAGSEISQMATNLSSVAERLEGSAEKLGQSQTEFAGSLRSMSGDLQQTLQRLAEEMSAQQVQGRQSLRESIESIQQGTAQLLGRMHESVSTTATTLESVGVVLARRVNESADRAVESLAGAVSQGNELLALTQQAIVSCRQTIVLLGATLDKLRDAHGSLSLTAGQLAPLPQKLTETASKLAEAGTSVVGASNRLDKAADEIRNEHGRLQASFASYEQRFAQVDKAVQALFTEVNDGVESYTGQVREFNTSFERHFSEATGILSGCVTEMREAIEDLTEVLGKPATSPDSPGAAR